MIWRRSHRFDPAAAVLADRHYNRRAVGSPQFMPPGRCLVLVATDGQAVWGTSWQQPEWVRHAWPGAWVNSLFRREGGEVVASEMIRQAIAATRHRWPATPAAGMVTFVDRQKVRAKRDPGRCYRRAGFVEVGETQGGLVVLQMLPEAMPEAEPPIAGQLVLEAS